MWKMKPWAYFFISIARRPEGNYFFPLWNRGNVACHRSQLTIFQYEKPFAQAANWNLNRNLLGANCQSKYQHCVTILQSGAQTNNRFHCNRTLFLMTINFLTSFIDKVCIYRYAAGSSYILSLNLIFLGFGLSFHLVMYYCDWRRALVMYIILWRESFTTNNTYYFLLHFFLFPLFQRIRDASVAIIKRALAILQLFAIRWGWIEASRSVIV